MLILDSMGHLYSTTNLKELYDFAINELNFKPEWNHLGTLFPHFDVLTESKKKKCLKLGVKFMDVKNREEHANYKECKIWFAKLLKEEHCKGNVFWYESKGLYNQKIYRIDFSKIKHHL